MQSYTMQKNQVITISKGEKYFFSYGTLIAKYDVNNTLYVDSYYWNYSRTTLKYFKQFLNTTKSKKELIVWLQEHAIFADLQGK